MSNFYVFSGPFVVMRELGLYWRGIILEKAFSEAGTNEKRFLDLHEFDKLQSTFSKVDIFE